MTEKQKIMNAFRHAQSRRPYTIDASLLDGMIPPGGEWTCEVSEGHVTRMIAWGGAEVALLNPKGDLGDATEGDIAMGLRAMPMVDCVLRAIMVLAEDPANLDLIRRVCCTAVAYIEQPAPLFPETEEDEGDPDEG